MNSSYVSPEPFEAQKRNMGSTVSISICTSNRSNSLRLTLKAFAELNVPQGYTVELLVIDNASTDDTQAVVEAACGTERRIGKISCRYVFEAQRGLSNARNRALLESKGDAILFTDDDVRPRSNWIEQMSMPLLSGTADLVTGVVLMPSELERPWLQGFLRGWVACSQPAPQRSRPIAMVGANMGFHRKVLQQVPQFDPELGAGALGFGEESLFSHQAERAGFKLSEVNGSAVEHYFGEDRLSVEQFEKNAISRGRSMAYIMWHWEHGRMNWPRLKLGWLKWKLLCRDLFTLLRTRTLAPLPWRVVYLFEIAMIEQFLLERKRPRCYEKFGLRKIEHDAFKGMLVRRIPSQDG